MAFGLFIAHVQPGTEFTLEQGPVGGGVWLPTQFDQTVKADILFFWSHNSSEQDTYWDYRRAGQARKMLGRARGKERDRTPPRPTFQHALGVARNPHE